MLRSLTITLSDSSCESRKRIHLNRKPSRLEIKTANVSLARVKIPVTKMMRNFLIILFLGLCFVVPVQSAVPSPSCTPTKVVQPVIQPTTAVTGESKRGVHQPTRQPSVVKLTSSTKLDGPTTQAGTLPTLVTGLNKNAVEILLPCQQRQRPTFITASMQSCNGCFISSISNYSPLVADGPSRYTPVSYPQNQGRMLGTKGVKMKEIVRQDDEPPRSSPLRLFPVLQYGLVPFLPATLLEILNDNYQFAKDQFGASYAALPPDVAKDSSEYLLASSVYDDAMKKLFVLLLSKRLALYFLATTATLYAGWRASSSVAAVQNGVLGVGSGLDRLNREILEGEAYSTAPTGEQPTENRDTFAFIVDQNPETSSNVAKGLAAVLPIILSGALATSYFAIGASSNLAASTEFGELPDVIKRYLPLLSSLPTIGVAMLFVAAEFRWAVCDETLPKSRLLCPANIAAFVYVSVAYVAQSVNPTLLPLHNGVNFALAVAVSRALAPFLVKESSRSLQFIAIALLGLTLFDVVSVFGTGAVANAATDETAVSVMETVARSKIATSTSSVWAPGLLEVTYGGKPPTEALGLGDVVFPSLLLAWSFAVDSSDHCNKERYGYTKAATLGYVLGSAATEIVGSFSILGERAGLPALLFLVPCMLGAVTVSAWFRGELSEIYGLGEK